MYHAAMVSGGPMGGYYTSINIALLAPQYEVGPSAGKISKVILPQAVGYVVRKSSSSQTPCQEFLSVLQGWRVHPVSCGLSSK